ncbi:hypothetical protein Tcan_10596, partial [Toxocara canis]
ENTARSTAFTRNNRLSCSLSGYPSPDSHGRMGTEAVEHSSMSVSIKDMRQFEESQLEICGTACYPGSLVVMLIFTVLNSLAVSVFTCKAVSVFSSQYFCKGNHRGLQRKRVEIRISEHSTVPNGMSLCYTTVNKITPAVHMTIFLKNERFAYGRANVREVGTEHLSYSKALFRRMRSLAQCSSNDSKQRNANVPRIGVLAMSEAVTCVDCSQVLTICDPGLLTAITG